MKKKVLIISIVIVLIGVAVAVFAILNSKNSAVDNLPVDQNNEEQINQDNSNTENEIVDKTKSEDYQEVPLSVPES